MASITLNPSAEVFVSGYNTGTNYSSSNFLRVGYGSTTSRCYYTYLNFGVKSNIPKGSTITKAVLSLYSYSNECWQAETDLVCKRVTSTWSASSVTWDTRPSETATNKVIGTFKGYDTWYSFTITDLVKDMFNASTNYGLIIKPNTSTLSEAKCFRKNTSGYEPKLVITYTEPSLKITYYGNGATGVGSSSANTSTDLADYTQTVTYSSAYSAYNLSNVSSLFTKTGHQAYSSARSWRVGSADSTTYLPDVDADLTSYLEAGGGTLKLYAYWRKNKLTITYDANGGTQGSDATKTLPYVGTHYYGTTYDLYNYSGTFDLTRPYYHILSTSKAWNTKSDGSGVSYDQNTDISAEDIATKAGLNLATGDRSLTFYANWTPNTLSITYDANGGTQASGNSYTMPYTATFLANKAYSSGLANTTTFGLSKEYYHFEDGKEWNTEADGSGTNLDHDKSYATGQALASAVGVDISSGNKSVTLYANWKPNSLTVYYYGNGATGLGTASGVTTYDPKSNLTTVVTYGSSHAAKDLWNVASLFKKTGNHRVSASEAWRVGSATATTYMSETSANFSSYLKSGTASVNLYANWTPNILTITYNANGGIQTSTAVSNGYELPFTSTHEYGSNYNGSSGLLNTTTFGLSKDYYHFEDGKEWNTKSDGSGTSLDHDASYTTNNLATALGLDLSTGNRSATIYANWKPNKFILYYDDNGSTSNTSSYTFPIKTTGTYGYNYNTTLGLYNTTDYLKKLGYHIEDGKEWNTKSDGSGESFDDSPSYTSQALAEALGIDIRTSTDNSITLYANWTPNIFSLTYEANGGKQSDAAISKGYQMPYTTKHTYGSTYNSTNGLLNITTFGLSKLCYRTKGDTAWSTETDGSGIIIDEDQSYTTNELATALGVDLSTGNRSVTIYANWKPVGRLHTSIGGVKKKIRIYVNVGGVMRPMELYVGDSQNIPRLLIE